MVAWQDQEVMTPVPLVNWVHEAQVRVWARNGRRPAPGSQAGAGSRIGSGAGSGVSGTGRATGVRNARSPSGRHDLSAAHPRQDGKKAERRRRQVNRARARLPVDDASLGLVKVDMRPPPSTHGEVELLRVRDQLPQTVTQLTETQKPWRSGFWAGRAVVSDGLRPSIRRAWSPDRKRRAPFKLARPTKRGRKPCPLWDFDANREIPPVNVKRSASP